MSEFDRVVQALVHPDAYPEGPDEVGHSQTHISHLFFTPQFVYKLKKPVDFGFLDFSTFEKRRFFCQQEVELNRRMSPDVYLEVVEVRRGPDGRITLAGAGEVVEHVVKMRRLPPGRAMVHMLEANQVTEGMVRDLGRLVGEFHLRADKSPHIASFGSPAALAALVDENFSMTDRFAGRAFSMQKYERLRAYFTGFLQNHAGLLERRVEGGRVRDCHGDLHAAQVFFTEQGIRIIDCIEFGERFRSVDILSDAAFMAMDLDHAGRHDLARGFIAAWREVTGDEDVPAHLDFYKAYRAHVRAKVESLRSEDSDVPWKEQAGAAGNASSYFNLAYFYAHRQSPPLLLLCAGKIGTGKSTLASGLAEAAGFAVLSSDVVRKQLAGIPLQRHEYCGFQDGIYAPDFTRRTYQELLDQAGPLLSDGHSVVLDATFGKRWQREAAATLAAGVGADFRVVECIASEQAVRGRLRRRRVRGTGASDAGWEVFQQERVTFEPLKEVRPDHYVRVQTSGRPVTESVREVLERFGID